MNEFETDFNSVALGMQQVYHGLHGRTARMS